MATLAKLEQKTATSVSWKDVYRRDVGLMFAIQGGRQTNIISRCYLCREDGNRRNWGQPAPRLSSQLIRYCCEVSSCLFLVV